MPKREEDDLRIHILAEAGALERQGHPSWPQRESFIAQTQRAKSVEELVECARQLEEAAFDWWTPALDSGCPCCDKRTIEPSLSVPQMLSKLRDFIWEFAEFAQLEERTDPNYDLEEQIGALVWARFHEVDLDNSGFGYCSLTASCAEEPHYMAWKRSHRETCQACRPRHVGEPLGDGDFARLSRLRFAEGLSQVLGLRMPWISLRSLVDELSRGDAHGRIAFEDFVDKAVRSKKPRERQLVALSLRRLAVPFWSALEREGAQALCDETATLSRATFLTFCKEIGAPTLDRESLEAIFGDVGYSDGAVLRVQAFWRDIALLNIARLTKRLPKNASGPAAKLLRARIAFATRFVNHLDAKSL